MSTKMVIPSAAKLAHIVDAAGPRDPGGRPLHFRKAGESFPLDLKPTKTMPNLYSWGFDLVEPGTSKSLWHRRQVLY